MCVSICVECDCRQNVVVSVKDEQQTCEHVARHYTIGVHKTLPPLYHNCLFLSVVLLFCPASFVMVFISLKDTKTSLLSERRVIYNHLH